MQPRYPRQGDQSGRYMQQLQTQHDVDIKRLWGILESMGNPYSGPSDISLPTTTTSTTSTTTASPPCCASYSCADVFIPDLLDIDGVTPIPGGWFRITGTGCYQSGVYDEYLAPFNPYITFGEYVVPGRGTKYVLAWYPQGTATWSPLYEWYYDVPISCPGPNNSADGVLRRNGGIITEDVITETASVTWVDCSDPTSTTSTTSTTTGAPTSTTTTTTTTTSTTTAGELPTTTTTTTSTTTGGGGGTTTTSTTTGGGGGGGCFDACQWEWSPLGPGAGWVSLTSCSGACKCDNGSGGELIAPPRDGYYLGELYTVGCVPI